MARLNLEKMSFAELSKLRLHVDHLMVEKQTSEKSALRQKMAEMAEAAGMSLDALFGKARKGRTFQIRGAWRHRTKYLTNAADRTARDHQ